VRNSVSFFFITQPPSWLNDWGLDGRFSSSGHHPVPSSHEVQSHGFGMKAHSLLSYPPFPK
jgi:hypothetical protein